MQTYIFLTDGKWSNILNSKTSLEGKKITHTIACSILLSIATVLDPEALKRKKKWHILINLNDLLRKAITSLSKVPTIDLTAGTFSSEKTVFLLFFKTSFTKKNSQN